MTLTKDQKNIILAASILIVLITAIFYVIIPVTTGEWAGWYAPKPTQKWYAPISPQPKCVDSDASNDVHVKGKAAGTNQTIWDKCNADNTGVFESYCGTGYWEGKAFYFTRAYGCPANEMCYDGVCQPTPDFIVDSLTIEPHGVYVVDGVRVTAVIKNVGADLPEKAVFDLGIRVCKSGTTIDCIEDYLIPVDGERGVNADLIRIFNEVSEYGDHSYPVSALFTISRGGWLKEWGSQADVTAFIEVKKNVVEDTKNSSLTRSYDLSESLPDFEVKEITLKPGIIISGPPEKPYIKNLPQSFIVEVKVENKQKLAIEQAISGGVYVPVKIEISNKPELGMVGISPLIKRVTEYTYRECLFSERSPTLASCEASFYYGWYTSAVEWDPAWGTDLVIEVTVDPEDAYLESNEENNVYRVEQSIKPFMPDVVPVVRMGEGDCEVLYAKKNNEYGLPLMPFISEYSVGSQEMSFVLSEEDIKVLNVKDEVEVKEVCGRKQPLSVVLNVEHSLPEADYFNNVLSVSS